MYNGQLKIIQLVVLILIDKNQIRHYIAQNTYTILKIFSIPKIPMAIIQTLIISTIK